MGALSILEAHKRLNKCFSNHKVSTMLNDPITNTLWGMLGDMKQIRVSATFSGPQTHDRHRQTHHMELNIKT